MVHTFKFREKADYKNSYDPFSLLKKDVRTSQLINEELEAKGFESIEEIDINSRDGRESRSVVIDLMLERVKELNPQMTIREAQAVKNVFVRCFLRPYIFESDAQIFSMFSLNEFLAQDDYETYGSYLDANWKNAYESTLNFTYNSYAHTDVAFLRFSSAGILHLTDEKPQEAVELIKALNKAQILHLTENAKINLADKPNSNVPVLKHIHAIELDHSNQRSKEEISNELYSFIAKVIGNASYSSKNNFRDTFSQAISSITSFTARRLKSELTDVSERDCSTNEVGKVTGFLNAHALEFTLAEAELIIYSLEESARVVNRFDAKAYINFLNRVIETRDSTRAINVIKNLNEIRRADVNLKRPDWSLMNKLLDDGSLDSMFTGDVFLMLHVNQEEMSEFDVII